LIGQELDPAFDLSGVCALSVSDIPWFRGRQDQVDIQVCNLAFPKNYKNSLNNVTVTYCISRGMTQFEEYGSTALLKKV
jgi:hypothetical protein